MKPPDIKSTKLQAHKNPGKGAATEYYQFNLADKYEMLNSSLVTEVICALRYKQHYFKVLSLGVIIVAHEFLEHANHELQHADMLAHRIIQLGGQPNYNPSSLSKRAHADYVDCGTIEEMLKENLIAKGITIDTYRQNIMILGKEDSTTRKILEDILAVEEVHANNLLDLATKYKI